MKREITVNTTSVYDARALAQLVGKANEFTSKIMMDMESRCINVKSIMGVMGLGLGQSRQKYMNIPEPQNDFIFAILAEEFGLLAW